MLLLMYCSLIAMLLGHQPSPVAENVGCAATIRGPRSCNKRKELADA